MPTIDAPGPEPKKLSRESVLVLLASDEGERFVPLKIGWTEPNSCRA